MVFHDGDLDSDTANRLLAGRLEPDDAPPDYREVAQLLQDARTGNGLPYVTDDAVIVAIVDAITATAPRRRKKHVLTRMVTTKLAVTAGVLALTATGAAAATGSLPDRAQRGISHVVSHIGIDLPDSAGDAVPPSPPSDAGIAPDEPTHRPAPIPRTHSSAPAAKYPGRSVESAHDAGAPSREAVPTDPPAAVVPNPDRAVGPPPSDATSDRPPSGNRADPGGRDHRDATRPTRSTDPVPTDDHGTGGGRGGEDADASGGRNARRTPAGDDDARRSERPDAAVHSPSLDADDYRGR
jgi:hypothetical protein